MSKVSEDKRAAVDLASKLLKEYGIVYAADLYKLSSVMLQGLRRQLRGQVEMKCIKNTLMRIAMDKSGLEGAEEFLSASAGPTIFIFARGNPFRLAMMLNRNKVKVFAKPGDIALDSIVIPAGNTGLSPGPIISKFGTLGIRTRIEGGNVWVNQDAEVAKPGDKLSEDLTDILTRLGIKAAEMGLTVKACYDRGLIIHGRDLLLDVGTYQDDLKRAHSDAFQVALGSQYLTPQTAPTLLAKAFEDARKVALEAEYVTPETVRGLVARASAQSQLLESLVQGKGAGTSA